MPKGISGFREMAKAEAIEKKGLVTRGTDFCRESWAELKRVHTPTKPETIAATSGVLMMVVFFSILLGIFDLIIGSLMRAFLAL